MGGGRGRYDGNGRLHEDLSAGNYGLRDSGGKLTAKVVCIKQQGGVSKMNRLMLCSDQIKRKVPDNHQL